MSPPYTEQQLINALRRIEKRWPEGYMLFSWSGSLCLMRKDRMMIGCNNAIVAEFSGISNDGGDPD